MTVNRQVAFYFDFVSPYAYLAWSRLDQLSKQGPVDLELKPVLFAGLLSHWGQLGPAEIPAKRAFIIRDTMRYAKRHGIPFEFPKEHPFRPLLALRASLREVCGNLQAQVVSTLWKHGWQNAGDMSDEAAVIAALDQAGLEGAALVAKTKHDDVKSALRDQTAAAVARDVFGVPTMLAGDALFWGNDRVDDVLEHLDGGDPLDEARAVRA